MSDYGSRISIDGQDVKTCSDLDTVVNSKYSNLKGAISGSGSVTLASGASANITIAHSLGYIPFAKVLLQPTNSIDLPAEFYNIPIKMDDVIDHLYSWHYFSSTQLTIHIEQWTGDGTSRTYNYKYFIYLDKGKL